MRAPYDAPMYTLNLGLPLLVFVSFTVSLPVGGIIIKVPRMFYRLLSRYIIILVEERAWSAT